MPDSIEKTELLCVGNAMVDVFAPAGSAWLDGLGITEPVQHIPQELAERVLRDLRQGGAGADLVLASGGAAANVAKVASMLNTKAAFVGCLGRDDLAAFFEEELRKAEVVPLLASGNEGTGICLVLGADGETRIAASPGSAFELAEADIGEDLVAGADAVVLDGYMLDRRPLVQRVLRLASRHGIPIALDAASVFQIKEKTEAILQYSRTYPLIVFMNADESIVFYNTIRKSSGADEAMTEREKEVFILREICPVLKGMTEGDIFPVIVIKLGGRGAVVLAGGNIHRVGTFAIIPRNAVGAGDAFCAAFMSAWIRGKTIRECASLGNKVAREVLMVPGSNVKKEKLASFAKLLR